jgi:lipopolysaccharide biosynthesis glycosyltransferase
LFNELVRSLSAPDKSKFTKQIDESEEHINVFLAADDNYAKYLASVMASILYNTNSFVDFYILETTILQENKDKLQQSLNKFNNFTLEFIPITKKMIDGIIAFKTIKYEAYYNRLLIPVLKPAIKKAIYFDVDITVLGDIKELWEQDLGDNILGAVFDLGINGNEKIGKEYHYRTSQIVDEKHVYFNSGVLLVNYDKWIEVESSNENIVEELFAVKLKIKGTDVFRDQNLLNHYFANKGYYKTLPIKFNAVTENMESAVKLFNRLFAFSKEAHDNINQTSDKIVMWHFARTGKPWKENILQLYAKDWWFYTSMTDFYDELKNKLIYPK